MWSAQTDEQASVTYKVLDATGVLPQNNRRVVIRGLAFRLRIDAPELKLFPHLLQQLVDIPAVLGADGTRVGDPVYQVELLDRNGVNLVKGIYYRDVAPALRLQNIDQVIDLCITTNSNVSRRDLVLAHHGFDFLADNVSFA